MEYLAHVISKVGIVVDPDKVSRALQRSIFKNVKRVRLIIADYGKIAKPLKN